MEGAVWNENGEKEYWVFVGATHTHGAQICRYTLQLKVYIVYIRNGPF